MAQPAYALTIACVVLAPFVPGINAQEKPVLKRGPRASLPSEPGDHIVRLKSLGDDQWLDLGSPAADPKWGKALGRSYNSKMAFAPDLSAAFLYGEGGHGWVKPDGHYMDDVWAYDVNAHRWICIYPGTHTKTVDLVLDENGFERTRAGELVPVAQMVHGYEMYTYDTDRRKFMFIPGPGDYWRGPLLERRKNWLTPRAVISGEPIPWLYDVGTGQWERSPLTGDVPSFPSYICVQFHYLSSKKQVLYCYHGDVWFFEPPTNRWTHAQAGGPRPKTTYNAVACHDTKRDRIYFGAPVDGGQGSVPSIYDVKSNTWIDPKPNGLPKARTKEGSCYYVTEGSHMTYDAINDVVVLIVHHHDYYPDATGLYIYDPQANTWTTAPREIPRWANAPAAFYDPALNVHFFHVATDNQVGTMYAYRYKGAPAK